MNLFLGQTHMQHIKRVEHSQAVQDIMARTRVTSNKLSFTSKPQHKEVHHYVLTDICSQLCCSNIITMLHLPVLSKILWRISAVNLV